MNKHLTQEQFVGYINQTLTDVQREIMDQHLETCPRCRARLGEHEALERRIHHSLLADLRTVQPSPAMTFAAIAPRLKHPRTATAPWGRSRSLLAGATALISLTTQIVVLIALFGALSQPIAASAQVLGYQSPPPVVPIEPTGSVGGVLSGGWTVEGSRSYYEMGIDHTAAHSGQASGYVRSVVAQPGDLGGTLVQRFRADGYRGARLRMTAYAKATAVERQATLWLRVVGPMSQTLALDDMRNRPIRGTTEWQAYAIVVDVPAESVLIEFGVTLLGKGQVWVDDFQFETD